MSGNKTASFDQFDISPYTQAPLRMRADIGFEGKRCEEVFAVLGDPMTIPDWYLLAKEIRMHPVEEGEDPKFNVVFTFFGDVYEEVLHWDPPHRYVYLARGDDFPIKDYIAQIEVFETTEREGIMRWSVYCNVIEGEHFQKILPVILPPINEASMRALAPLIGGVSVAVESSF